MTLQLTAELGLDELQDWLDHRAGAAEWGHEVPPTVDASVVEQCDWLDDYIADAARARSTPAQAQLLGNALLQRHGGHPFSPDERETSEDLLEVCWWLIYWGTEGKFVRGGQK